MRTPQRKKRLTLEPVAIGCTTLQGRLELHKKRFPKTYSTYPHPVLNDDD